MNTRNPIQYKDIPTILLENRIINLTGEVNDELAHQVNSLLQVLNEESKTKPIQLFINSPGGSCIAGLSIIDTILFIEAPVYGIVQGMAASMGAVILSICDKRMALPNSKIMVHQASGGFRGNIQDARVDYREFEDINNRLATIISNACGISVEDYFKETERDHWMWPEEAIKFGSKGIIDEIISVNKKNGGKK